MSFRRRLMMACVRNRGVPVTVTSMFTKRTTGDGITILNNKALLKGIRGNSLIWNAIRDGNWINNGPTTISGITYQIVNKNTTVNGTSTRSGTYVQPTFSTYSNCKGHKLLILNKTNNNPNNNVYFVTNGFSIYAEFSDSRILTVTSQTARLYLRYKTDLGRTYNNAYMACPIAIDLTRMFGAGNEPTTVNAFKKLFPFDLEDYSNSGIVINNSMTNYVSKDGDEETLQNVSLNVPTLTGKLNGEGESVVVFPNGMKSTVNPYNAELSYITKNNSTGGYFKIPYVPTGRDIKIKIKFTLTSAISSASYLTIFRAYTGESYEAYRIIRNGASNTNYIFSCGGRASNSRVLDLSLNTVYTIEMTINSVTINNTAYSLYDDVGSENTGQFELMAGYNMTLYYFQVYKANELVVDCVPYRKDMVGAIKERISDTIIYPTTGTITCGTLTEASESAIYDEIKQDENGAWEAYKRVGDTRATNAISGRAEYDSLEQEEVYVLDDQTIPTEITIADQGVEEILPTNGATPTTAPAIMEIEYRAAPVLTSFSLGNPLGGGLQNIIPSDNNITDDIEEIQEIDDTTDI